MDLHSGLEVTVREFQVMEILPDLTAEHLACSYLLLWSGECSEFRDLFFSGEEPEGQLTSQLLIYSKFLVFLEAQNIIYQCFHIYTSCLLGSQVKHAVQQYVFLILSSVNQRLLGLKCLVFPQV